MRLKGLDHPALAVRMESQRILQKKAGSSLPLLVERLKSGGAEAGRLHALWALDAIGGDDARRAIGEVLADPSARVRLQAARSAGIRCDRTVLNEVCGLLADRDPAVRREAAIALGRLGDRAAAVRLYAALGDSDPFADWSVRQAIRRIGAWDKDALVEALLDERRLESGLRLTDESWELAVVEALTAALSTGSGPGARSNRCQPGRALSPLSGVDGPMVRHQSSGR